jgi:membrane protein DedA with SNARE-associated domain
MGCGAYALGARGGGAGPGRRRGAIPQNVAPMGHAVTTFVQDHGILAVFVLMVAESCGIPFPSEVTMPLAGYLAHAGHLSLAGAIAAGVIGNLLGSLLAWWLAFQFGEAVLLGPGRWLGIRRSHVESADRWFQRYGLLAVFFGRLLPVVRTYISFPAGLARVPVAPFSLLTVAGVLPWVAALAGAGYAVGASYDKISGPIEKAAIVLAVIAVLGLVAWVVRGRRASATR